MHDAGSEPIEEKCEFFESHLEALKPALDDSNVIKFYADIKCDSRKDFNDSSLLLDYIRNRFLPICNSSHCYKFEITFFSDENSDTNVISSILHMYQIKNCSRVKIMIYNGAQTQLPVEEISNWLEQLDDGMENIVRNQKERMLEIGFGTCGAYHHAHIQNVREMIDHLKTVYFIIF